MSDDGRETKYLPARPLHRLIERLELMLGLETEEFASWVGCTSRHIQRVKANDVIGMWAADHMAIRCGSHPILLWPKEWESL